MPLLIPSRGKAGGTSAGPLCYPQSCFFLVALLHMQCHQQGIHVFLFEQRLAVKPRTPTQGIALLLLRRYTRFLPSRAAHVLFWVQ